MTLAKNEILTLKAELKIGDKVYPANGRFVVIKVAKGKIYLRIINADDSISDQGIEGSMAAILSRFNVTGQKYLAPKDASVEVKKGSFYTFKKEFNDKDVKFPVGTRVVIVKGGKRPEFFTHFTQESGKNIDGLIVHPQFIAEYFEAAEAAACDLTADWKMKGYQEIQGEETRNFTFNLYYKGKKMGGASNDGQGGCHRVHVYGEEWKALNKAALEICQAADTSKSERFSIKAHDVSEYLIDFFLDNHNGLSTLKEYLEARVKNWCETLIRYNRDNQDS